MSTRRYENLKTIGDMKFFTKEVRIALVAIAGIIVLFFGMFFHSNNR